ncbi:MAG: NAD(P)-binding protein, partial [Terriglobales bacterium]
MSDLRKPSRRQAIRYLIGGAMAAACPVPLSSWATPAYGQRMGSEENILCHQVRDGVRFPLPAPSAEHEVVIVGGGPSGLMAGYKLREHDFLLLEKEPRLGGNAIPEEWNGVWYSTGAAYQMDDTLEG